MTRVLGRIPSRRDDRTLRFSAYLAGGVHAAPLARDWTHPELAPAWRAWANDRIGDCTCAAVAHALQAAAAHTLRDLPITEAEVIDLYARASGYDPARPETDRGAQMLDVLRLLRSRGLAGVRFEAYASVNPMSRAELEAAVNLCGWAYVGVQLPNAARNQTVWDVARPGAYDETYRPGSWGGHAMALLGYDRSHVTFLSWGQVRVATVEWLMTYADEAWAVIDDAWIRRDGLTPSGFDLAQLRADVAAIGAA